jgi:hypothetical protein
MTSDPADRPFYSLLANFPDLRSLSDRLGLPYATVAAWKRRDSIPERYWREIAKAARSLRVTGVSYDHLSRASAAKRNPRRAGA